MLVNLMNAYKEKVNEKRDSGGDYVFKVPSSDEASPNIILQIVFYISTLHTDAHIKHRNQWSTTGPSKPMV